MVFVVQYSGGVGSWAAAKLLVDQYGPEQVHLLFADTLTEDEDLYRFLDETQKNLGSKLIRLEDGRDIWEVFADKRYLGNSRIDPCSRILKRDFLREYIDTHYDPDEDTVVLGIDWSEMNRLEKARPKWEPWTLRAPLCEPPYYSKDQLFEWLKNEDIPPPWLYELDFAHNNPMSGDTRVITMEGTQTLRELAEQDEVTLLGRGAKWVDAEVHSFGVQRVREITLQRYGREKRVYATSDHRWFKVSGPNKKKEVFTDDLRPGDRLNSMYSKFHSSIRPSAFGVAHGIVYGDGTRPVYTDRAWNPPANVVLCGEKTEFLKWFPNSPTKEVPQAEGVRVNDLPQYFKERPSLRESKSYLYGFLAGYFAMDGSVDGNGCPELSSASKSDLQFARDVATILGIKTYSIRSYRRRGINGVVSRVYDLPFQVGIPQEFFLRTRHYENARFERMKVIPDWTVVSVEDFGDEEVFCPMVPEGHSFTLEDNILTGNCGGACVKAGQAQWKQLYQHMPERFAYHAQKEQEMRELLGKDVTILRRQRNGVRENLTLWQLKAEIDAENDDTDPYDIGGCGCAID